VFVSFFASYPDPRFGGWRFATPTEAGRRSYDDAAAPAHGQAYVEEVSVRNTRAKAYKCTRHKGGERGRDRERERDRCTETVTERQIQRERERGENGPPACGDTPAGPAKSQIRRFPASPVVPTGPSRAMTSQAQRNCAWRAPTVPSEQAVSQSSVFVRVCVCGCAYVVVCAWMCVCVCVCVCQ
jgi:hypothetical protein